MVARMPVPGPVVQPHSYEEDQSRWECAEIMDDWRRRDRGAIRSYAQFQRARLTMEAKIACAQAVASIRTAVHYPFEFGRWLEQHATSTRPLDRLEMPRISPARGISTAIATALGDHTAASWTPAGGSHPTRAWCNAQAVGGEIMDGVQAGPGIATPTGMAFPFPRPPARRSATISADASVTKRRREMLTSGLLSIFRCNRCCRC
ncbi:hypothetical protein B0H13DRAFT_2348799 [Mycena leptocephala]|nr:hypothetical protein B0H13DRAFT_2348799 [Mycena leptocephala]